MNRTCKKCEQEKPLESFHSRGRGKRGYTCTSCHSKSPAAKEGRKTRRKRLRDTAKQINELTVLKHQELEEHREEIVLEAIRKAGLNALATYLRAPGTKIPHAAEALEAATEALGGVGQIWAYAGSILYSPDAKMREKIGILEMYQRLLLKTTEVGAAKKPIDIMTDEDVDREFESLNLERMKRNAIEVHGSHHPTPSATS